MKTLCRYVDSIHSADSRTDFHIGYRAHGVASTNGAVEPNTVGGDHTAGYPNHRNVHKRAANSEPIRAGHPTRPHPYGARTCGSAERFRN